MSWDTLDRLLALSIWDDIYKRPYITIGFTALTLMLPLAITSTAGWIGGLGGKRWNALHRLVYIFGRAGASLHYWWLVKADISRPEDLRVIVAVLLAFRLWWAWSKRSTAARERPLRGRDTMRIQFVTRGGAVR